MVPALGYSRIIAPKTASYVYSRKAGNVYLLVMKQSLKIDVIIYLFTRNPSSSQPPSVYFNQGPDSRNGTGFLLAVLVCSPRHPCFVKTSPGIHMA